MGFKVNLDGKKFDDADKGSGIVEPGWHRAVVEDCLIPAGEDQYRFTWKITSLGISNGGKVWDYLQSPEAGAQHKDGGEFLMKRTLRLAKSLGIWSEEMTGEEDFAFEDTIGLECVVRVKHKMIDGMDGRGKACKVMDPAGKMEIEPMGIFGLNHPDIPPAVRVQLGLPLLEGQTLEPVKTPAAKRGGTTKKSATSAAGNGAAPAPAPVADISDL